MSEPGTGREAENEFHVPQLLPLLHPSPQCPPPLLLTLTQCCQCFQQAPLELISFCRTLKCQPKLAVTQAPVVEDGVYLVVNQAWPQGTLQGSLGQEEQVRHLLPAMCRTSPPPRLSAYPRSHFSILGVSLNLDQYHSPILSSRCLILQYFSQAL